MFETPTPQPTSTPIGIEVITVVPPGSETSYPAVYRYEMTTGDVVISMLLFGVLMLVLFNTVLIFWRRS